MTKGSSTPTRVAADIAATAAPVAPVAPVAPTESRTVTEQINHWARVGMQIERSGSVATLRALAVAAGDAQLSTLTPEERATAHWSMPASRGTGCEAALRSGRPGRWAHHRVGRRRRQPDRDRAGRELPSAVSRVDLIAGPNGTGTTTLYERVIASGRPGLPFVNADQIARNRFPGQKLEHAYEAASIAAAAVPHCYCVVFYDDATDHGPAEVGSFRYGVRHDMPRRPPWTPEPLLGLSS